ncbi:class I SAM-dependent methyltransferase [Bacillus pinisoli]|uniref:class I SAM-dependent methyltransferase n=1 Tax=Bacillus pinisoli TaxID=2901866 RepID=UPI001FF33FDC|nr:class I SAM-dependent methyltransferase [Bacillus pinisoli]
MEQNEQEINAGERIYPKAFNEAAPDHKERYQLALNYIKNGDSILDVATGVGYGAYYMSVNTACERVVGVDINDHALEWAKKYFSSEKVTFIREDLLTNFSINLPVEKFDVITCFETIEHINQDMEFINRLFSLLKPGGILLISSPNEDVIPCLDNPFYEGGKNPHHYKHYTPIELRNLLKKNGFNILESFTQCPNNIVKGEDGFVIIYACSNNQVQENKLNSLDKAILKLNTLKMRRTFSFLSNYESQSIDITSIDIRLNELLENNMYLVEAYEQINNKNYEESIRVLEEIDKSLCPESYFWMGLLYQVEGNLYQAIKTYSVLLHNRNRINQVIIEHAEERMIAAYNELIKNN